MIPTASHLAREFIIENRVQRKAMRGMIFDLVVLPILALVALAAAYLVPQWWAAANGLLQ